MNIFKDLIIIIYSMILAGLILNSRVEFNRNTKLFLKIYLFTLGFYPLLTIFYSSEIDPDKIFSIPFAGADLGMYCGMVILLYEIFIYSLFPIFIIILLKMLMENNLPDNCKKYSILYFIFIAIILLLVNSSIYRYLIIYSFEINYNLNILLPSCLFLLTAYFILYLLTKNILIRRNVGNKYIFIKLLESEIPSLFLGGVFIMCILGFQYKYFPVYYTAGFYMLFLGYYLTLFWLCNFVYLWVYYHKVIKITDDINAVKLINFSKVIGARIIWILGIMFLAGKYGGFINFLTNMHK